MTKNKTFDYSEVTFGPDLLNICGRNRNMQSGKGTLQTWDRQKNRSKIIDLKCTIFVLSNTL